MQLCNVVLGIVVIAGTSLIGYGLFVGDGATWGIAVEPVAEDELQDDIRASGASAVHSDERSESEQFFPKFLRGSRDARVS